MMYETMFRADTDEIEDADYYEKNCLKIFKKIAGSLDKEDVYQKINGLVADNVGYNRTAMAKIKEQYPRLVVDGCVTHGFDLLLEDIAKMPELKKLLKECTDLNTYVTSHKYTKRLAKEGVEKFKAHGAKMLRSFPHTRFAYAHEIFDRVANFQLVLEYVIEHDKWDENKPKSSKNSKKVTERYEKS